MTVVKVGGSLFDMPNLAERLREFLETLTPPVVIVAGGGAVADAMRRLADTHRLSESTAHWATLKAIAATAELVRGWVIAGVEVLDCEAFCRADGTLPESWAMTTDSIAARFAAVNGADLILLKSVDWPNGVSPEVAAANGWVDAYFPTAAAGVTVRCVRFRNSQ